MAGTSESFNSSISGTQSGAKLAGSDGVTSARQSSKTRIKSSAGDSGSSTDNGYSGPTTDPDDLLTPKEKLQKEYKKKISKAETPMEKYNLQQEYTKKRKDLDPIFDDYKGLPIAAAILVTAMANEPLLATAIGVTALLGDTIMNMGAAGARERQIGANEYEF